MGAICLLSLRVAQAGRSLFYFPFPLGPSLCTCWWGPHSVLCFCLAKATSYHLFFSFFFLFIFLSFLFSEPRLIPLPQSCPSPIRRLYSLPLLRVQEPVPPGGVFYVHSGPLFLGLMAQILRLPSGDISGLLGSGSPGVVLLGLRALQQLERQLFSGCHPQNAAQGGD